MSQTAFAPSPELHAHVLRLLKAVETVTGVSRWAVLSAFGKRKMTRVRWAFRHALQQTTGLSFAQSAWLLGLDHTTFVLPNGTDHDLLERLLAMVPPLQGPALETRGQRRCPTCGQRTIGAVRLVI